jgi:hypothetical protein
MEKETMRRMYNIMEEQINYLELALQDTIPTLELYNEYKTKLTELKKIKKQLKKLYQL